jgi:hypothetical protein
MRNLGGRVHELPQRNHLLGEVVQAADVPVLSEQRRGQKRRVRRRGSTPPLTKRRPKDSTDVERLDLLQRQGERSPRCARNPRIPPP